MKVPAKRLIEEATDRLAALGNNRATALAVDAVIRLEANSRRLWTVYPQFVRAASGVAARHDIDTLNERIAAMDDRLKQLELEAVRGDA